MYINLPEPQLHLTEEEKEKSFWDRWRFDSHRFVEYEKGYAQCSFCGAVHTSTMPVNNFSICIANPAIKNLLTNQANKNEQA